MKVGQVEDASMLLESKPICCILPDHPDTKPSFTWSSEKKMFRCWSRCSTGGDVVRFVEMTKNINESAAIEYILSLFPMINTDMTTAMLNKLTKEVAIKYNSQFRLLLSEANRYIQHKVEDKAKAYVELDKLVSLQDDNILEDLVIFIDNLRIGGV